jgi:hypothetical protein
VHPPLHAVCAADTALVSLLSDTSSLLRIYPFGEARQQDVYPYVVWQIVSGRPENYLRGRPDADSFSTQIDVYARTWRWAGEVGDALQAAIEGDGYVTAYNGEMRDPETRSYRVSITVDWVTNR